MLPNLGYLWILEPSFKPVGQVRRSSPAGKPAFYTRFFFNHNSLIPSPRRTSPLFILDFSSTIRVCSVPENEIPSVPNQFHSTNLVERAGWRYRRACGSYCLFSVPQIGGIKQTHEPLTIATIKIPPTRNELPQIVRTVQKAP